MQTRRRTPETTFDDRAPWSPDGVMSRSPESSADAPQVVVCILGMHRSGTSCLAGTLEEAGVFLGDVFRKNRHNAKGNRENQRIIQFHDNMLAEHGGSWHAPPAEMRWSARHRQQRDDIIASYCDAPQWGFKDPRTVLALDGWLEALPQLRLVGIVRNPLAVAESLRARNGFSLAHGLALWTRYNERLLTYQVRLEFPLLSFDRDDDELRCAFSQALDKLALRRQPSRHVAVTAVIRRIRHDRSGSNQTFFDPALRHQRDVGHAVALPERTARLYQTLNARCL
jgi:hypothetical protein